MHNFAHFGQMDKKMVANGMGICAVEIHRVIAPAVDSTGFVAPPLRPSTGLKRWCNLTSSPWQPKTGGEGEEPKPVEMADRMPEAASLINKTLFLMDRVTPYLLHKHEPFNNSLRLLQVCSSDSLQPEARC